ncbi:MAG: hypothetical protein ACP5G4_07775, partial [bacterium]
MKTKAICLIGMIFLATVALAAPDSLACRMIDWLDALGETMQYGPIGYGDFYTGTCFWDMAISDTFLVWCPGTERAIFIKTLNEATIETTYCPFYSLEKIRGCTFTDSLLYLTGGGLIWSLYCGTDSITLADSLLFEPWASLYYAVILDSFLYTVSTGSNGLHCINIGNPESIFVEWTSIFLMGFCGFTIMDTFAYTATTGLYESEPYSQIYIPYWTWDCLRISGDSMGISVIPYENEDSVYFGGLADNGVNLFQLQTEMNSGGECMPYETGASYLNILDTEYCYTWAVPYGEPSFGVDVLNERILAVGFEHGFSILDYSDLDDIREVAYYRDTDSVFAFTHFALKDNRMFAMAHPRAGICRMYMFELDSTIWTGISDPIGNKGLQPLAFEIYAWPNPFNSSVTIAIEGVGDGSPVPFDVEIYDVAGRRVADAEPADKPHAVEAGAGWLGKDTSTGSVSVFAPLMKGG